MGIILSRYRRKKTSDELLEDIQNDITNLENSNEVSLQRQNYVVGRLIIYSVLLYILSAVLFYFCFFPASLADRIFYMIPLLIFPLIIVLLKKFITWYYKREIIHSKDKLADLKAKKKKILDDVMNKETYKVAKEILEKYAPEQLKKTVDPPPTKLVSLRLSPPKDQNRPLPPQMVKGPGPPGQPPGGYQVTPRPMIAQRQPSPQRKLVRPVIPRERNFMDRVIESLIGDGPGNRYALICRNCASHNGMALKEEFEYLAFRCAYCGFPNPSLKVRAPVNLPPGYRSRGASEERKGIEGVDTTPKREPEEDKKDDLIVDSNKLDGGENSPKESEADDGNSSIGPESDVGSQRVSSASESDSSTNPFLNDGIRPRKPLSLPD